MSGTAKRRREKARHRDRRKRRNAERFDRSWQTFEQLNPSSVASFNAEMMRVKFGPDFREPRPIMLGVDVGC